MISHFCMSNEEAKANTESKIEEHTVELESVVVTNGPQIDGFDLGRCTYEAIYVIDGNRVKYLVESYGGDIDYVNASDLVYYFRVHGRVGNTFINGDDLERNHGLCTCRGAGARLTRLGVSSD